MSIPRIVAKYRLGCELLDGDLLHLHLRNFYVEFYVAPSVGVLLEELLSVREKSEQEMVEALESLGLKDDGLRDIEDMLNEFFIQRAFDIDSHQRYLAERST